MKLTAAQIDMIVLPALHLAQEQYMKHAATCTTAGSIKLANQFLNQADQVKALIYMIQDHEAR